MKTLTERGAGILSILGAVLREHISDFQAQLCPKGRQLQELH